MQAVLFLAGLSSNRQSWQLSDRLLVLILASIAIILTHHGLFTAWPESDPRRFWFMGLSSAAWLVVPPAFYLYVGAIVRRDFRLQTWHFALFSIPIYHVVSWIWTMAGLRIGFYLLFEGYYDWYTYFWVLSYLGCAMGFAWASFRETQSLKGTELNWLRVGSLLFLIAGFIAFISFVVLVYLDQYSVLFEFSLLLLFAVFVLLLAYRSISSAKRAPWLGYRPYQKVGIPQGRLEELAQRLNTYMEASKPYLDPELNLATLSMAIECSEQELSQIFSRQLETNFYDYLSSYRVKAFEEAIRAGSAEQLTVVALAKQCGFKSKTAFYRVFKEKFGTTPAAYIKTLGSP